MAASHLKPHLVYAQQNHALCNHIEGETEITTLLLQTHTTCFSILFGIRPLNKATESLDLCFRRINLLIFPFILVEVLNVYEMFRGHLRGIACISQREITALLPSLLLPKSFSRVERNFHHWGFLPAFLRGCGVFFPKRERERPSFLNKLI